MGEAMGFLHRRFHISWLSFDSLSARPAHGMRCWNLWRPWRVVSACLEIEMPSLELTVRPLPLKLGNPKSERDVSRNSGANCFFSREGSSAAFDHIDIFDMILRDDAWCGKREWGIFFLAKCTYQYPLLFVDDFGAKRTVKIFGIHRSPLIGRLCHKA